MDCIDCFLQDIHSQRFYNGTLINPTRFFVIAAILKNGSLPTKYPKHEIESVVFRYYADNPNIAARHPRLEIRNIVKYGISVIKEEVKAALLTWQTEAEGGFLTTDTTFVHLAIDAEVDYSADVDYLWMVLEELFKKTYHIEFPTITPIEGNDTDLSIFGQGPYRSHLMEEMQYCVCCDEYSVGKLYAIHILPDEYSSDSTSRESISNGLLLCYEHAQEYLHKRFYFSEDGKVVNRSSSLVHRNMRLGIKLLTEERKKYLSMYQEHMEGTKKEEND